MTLCLCVCLSVCVLCFSFFSFTVAEVFVEKWCLCVVSGFSKLFSLEVLDVSDNKIAKVRMLVICIHAFFPFQLVLNAGYQGHSH